MSDDPLDYEAAARERVERDALVAEVQGPTFVRVWTPIEGFPPIEDTRTIFERMLSILAELPAIGKDQVNQQQGFHYRGHDDVMNALNPLLALHGVFFTPTVVERAVSERKTRSGGLLYEVNLHVVYTFYGARGDSFSASAWGEGTDSGDKSTNKAMTMALKNVLAQCFALATKELSDADAESPEETVSRGSGGRSRLGDLEKLIELVKEADQDPAHGGNHYYQVAVNAAKKYHGKPLEELAGGELHDLERRFQGLLDDLVGADRELPVEDTVVRQEPQQIPVPTSWAEIEQAVRLYGEPTWEDHRVFLRQAAVALFGKSEELDKGQRDLLFQKTASFVVKLQEEHVTSEFPPPIRAEFQVFWSTLLDGAMLEGPEWAMDPHEAEQGRPQRSGADTAVTPEPEARSANPPTAPEPPAPELPVAPEQGDASAAAVPPPDPGAESPEDKAKRERRERRAARKAAEQAEGAAGEAAGAETQTGEQAVVAAVEEEFPGATLVDPDAE